MTLNEKCPPSGKVAASGTGSYIGLAHRAGKTVFGSAACEKAVKRGKVCLLLLHSGMSEGSKETFRRLCTRCEVEIIETSERIGQNIGKPNVMVIGITEQGFAKTIRNKADSVKGSGKA